LIDLYIETQGIEDGALLENVDMQMRVVYLPPQEDDEEGSGQTVVYEDPSFGVPYGGDPDRMPDKKEEL
jgi:hypothetical protein